MIDRYTNTEQGEFKDEVYRGEILVQDPYTVIASNDFLPYLGFSFLGDSRNWWAIAEVNNIIDPFLSLEGKQLIIPAIEELEKLI